MMGIGYSDLLFVTHHPVHFRLEQLACTEDVWSRASERRRLAMLESGMPCADAIQRIVDDALKNNELTLSSHQPHEVALGLWTMSSGMHALVHTAGVLEHHRIQNPYGLLARNYVAYLNALGWQPLVTEENELYRAALRKRLHAEVFPEYQEVTNP